MALTKNHIINNVPHTSFSFDNKRYSVTLTADDGYTLNNDIYGQLNTSTTKYKLDGNTFYLGGYGAQAATFTIFGTVSSNKPEIKGSDKQEKQTFGGITLYTPSGLTGKIGDYTLGLYGNYVVLDPDNSNYNLDDIYYITNVNSTPTKFNSNYSYLVSENFSDDDASALEVMVVTDKDGTPLDTLPKKELVYTGNATTDNNNVTISVDKNIISFTPNDGYKITAISLPAVQSYPGGPMTSYSDDQVKINLNDLTATVLDYDIASDDLNFNVTTEKLAPTVYTTDLEKTGDTDTYTITPENIKASSFPSQVTITVTPNNGYTFKFVSLDKKDNLNFSGDWETVKEHDTNSSEPITFTIGLNNSSDITRYKYRINATTFKQVKKVDLSVDYDTKFTTGKLNNNIVTINTLNNYTINSLKPYVYQTWGVTEHVYLDNDNIKISDDKKSATITVPNEYLYTMYTLVINGDYTDNTPTPETNKGTDSIEIYTLTDNQLNKLSQQAIIRADSKGYSFSDFFKQIYRLPFHIPDSESTGTTNIKAGIYNLDVSARKFEKEHYILNVGNIKVNGENQNGFDYNISSITLYLPFISERTLNIDDVINKTISITYDVNLLDGKTSVIIKSDNNIISSGITNISTQLELFSIYTNKVVNTLNSTLANSIKQAYIKIEYNKPVPNLVSYETNEHGTIKDYNGYIQGVNMQGLGSLDYETQENIKAILNGGIFINDIKSN